MPANGEEAYAAKETDAPPDPFNPLTSPRPRGRPRKEVAAARLAALSAALAQLSAEDTSKAQDDTIKTLRKQSFIEPFLRLPSRRELPEYYELISQPMDILTIEQKMKKGEYKSLETFYDDLFLMCDNACAFNEDGSDLYRDALLIKDLVKKERSKWLVSISYPASESPKPPGPSPSTAAHRLKAGDSGAGEPSASPRTSTTIRIKAPASSSPAAPGAPIGSPSTPAPSPSIDPRVQQACSHLINSLKAMKDDGRSVIEPFMKLPTKHELPEYYQVIAHPIDLAHIEHKLKKGGYYGIEALCNDLLLMCENARTYNADDSLLFQDATRMKRLVIKERTKLLKTFPAAAAPPSVASPSHGSLIVTLGGSGSTNQAAAGGGGGGGGGALVSSMAPSSKVSSAFDSIVSAIKALPDRDGQSLMEPFVKLPTRRALPVYYEVITSPIDISTIEGKVKRKEYKNVEELTQDFILMCDNACSFNEDGSQLFLDAVAIKTCVLKERARLQKVLGAPSTSTAPSLKIKLPGSSGEPKGSGADGSEDHHGAHQRNPSHLKLKIRHQVEILYILLSLSPFLFLYIYICVCVSFSFYTFFYFYRLFSSYIYFFLFLYILLSLSPFLFLYINKCLFLSSRSFFYSSFLSVTRFPFYLTTRLVLVYIPVLPFCFYYFSLRTTEFWNFFFYSLLVSPLICSSFFFFFNQMFRFQ